ncbi:discoidin domain-containing protein [Streptacidiphilus jiangxiensis]|uniref:Putative Ig domain-containing protein n=1 Tax=Streptacidiphilus jiangxiensis TaxID=235985 RepID=A0A1H7ZNB9_STRJI|nr:discoidin domain-containing protein [Streptacidiphilus jiangxiensis]SEM58989.1 Putative Ig domain-containing protein [Streptacidiphilus jiangxiensis]
MSVSVLLGPGGWPAHAAARAHGTAAQGTVTSGGRCLDDANSGTADGNPVQMLGCDGSAAQAWTWNSADGSVQALGKCLQVTGGSRATGTPVELWSCSAATAEQHFAHLPDGTIYSAASGKCLAVQGAVVDGAGIGLASCDPSQSDQVWQAASAPAPADVLSSGTPVNFANPDDTPADVYTDKNGQFYYQSSHSLYGAKDSRQWDFDTGSDFDTATTAPIQNSGTNKDTTALCNNSPTGLTATYAPSGSGYAERNYCDLSGVWVDPDSGDWYGLVHNEFTPQPFGDGLHYDAIDYAKSTDQGHTWTIEGHAVTSPFSTKRNDTTQFPGATYYYGDGDQRLFVDNASGYFYAFYATRVLDKSAGGTVWLQHVARAPISAKMATASWQKWYDGSWSQPGVGGKESDVIPADGAGPGYVSPAGDYAPAATGTVAAQVAAGQMPDNSQLAVMNIAWDSYLGEYIGTPQNNVAQATGTLTPLHFYATRSLATEQWTDLGLVTGDPNGAWYRWMLDPANRTSSTVVGRTFRSYCAYYCSTDTAEYSDITIDPSSSANLPATPVTPGLTYTVAAGNGQVLTQSGSTLTATTGANGSAAQNWRFQPTGDGFWTVVNSATGQALGVDTGGNAGRAWGAVVTPTALGATPGVGQQWSLQPSTSGGSGTGTGIRLVNRYSGLALSLDAAAARPVATAPQRSWNNTGSAGDTRPEAAQLLAFSATGGTAADTVTVASPGPQSAAAGTAITPLQLSATDSAAGRTLRYAATGLPSGLSLDPATGRVTGTPTGNGTSTVAVTVTDTTGALGTASFTWSVTGTDLALGRPTTASSVQSGTSDTPDLATDGNPGTRWSSAFSDPQWLQVDLGATHAVNEVKLTWEAAYATAFQIQTSTDGTTWTTIYSTTTGTGGVQDLTGLTGSGRYLRMYGTQRATGYGYSLWSLEVYGG